MTRAPRPHDLLRITDVDAFVPDDAPAWVRTTLYDTPWVVVRRAVAPGTRHAVGVRGRSRHLRYPLFVPNSCVTDVVTPESVSGIRAWPTRGVPALQALRDVRASLNELHNYGVVWGPTGSVGFELTTGIRTVTSDSDLDVLLRCPRLTRQVVARLRRLQDKVLCAASAPVDCQVDTGREAFALAELIARTDRCLVRTVRGPLLVTNPLAR